MISSSPNPNPNPNPNSNPISNPNPDPDPMQQELGPWDTISIDLDRGDPEPSWTIIDGRRGTRCSRTGLAITVTFDVKIFS